MQHVLKIIFFNPHPLHNVEITFTILFALNSSLVNTSLVKIQNFFKFALNSSFQYMLGIFYVVQINPQVYGPTSNIADSKSPNHGE